MEYVKFTIILRFIRLSWKTKLAENLNKAVITQKGCGLIKYHFSGSYNSSKRNLNGNRSRGRN